MMMIMMIMMMVMVCYSFTHSLGHSVTRSFGNTVTHTITRSFIHSFIHTHSLVHSFNRSLIHLFIRSLIIRSLLHTFSVVDCRPSAWSTLIVTHIAACSQTTWSISQVTSAWSTPKVASVINPPCHSPVCWTLLLNWIKLQLTLLLLLLQAKVKHLPRTSVFDAA
jgi:hypothetical protein